MKRLTMITSLLVGVFFIFSLPDQAQAQNKIENPDIVIGIDGLACPFCAYGLEKKLKKLDGVADIFVDIDEGRTDIKLKKNASLGEEKIRKAVQDAGFTLTKLKYLDKSSQSKT